MRVRGLMGREIGVHIKTDNISSRNSEIRAYDLHMHMKCHCVQHGMKEMVEEDRMLFTT